MKKILPILLLVILILPASIVRAEVKTIHVLVALCDNDSQGISPVPKIIGNGDDPPNNLYWGAMYGVSTYLKKQKGWRLESRLAKPSDIILERLIFSKDGAYLIADAYAGRHIKKCTEDLFDFAAGRTNVPVELENLNLTGGAGADLLVYMGHNGLMDFDLEKYPVALKPGESFLDLPENGLPVVNDGKKREVAVFSCHSQSYFQDLIIQAGARPLILTRDLMAPEAYILKALAEGWLAGQSPEEIRERVAAAYNQYQKCGLKAARRTFSAGGFL